MIVSVGDRLVPGTYRLHSCFARAINFMGDHGLLTLANEEIGAGPVNIVVTSPPSPCPETLRLTPGAIHCGDLQLTFSPHHIYNSSLPLGVQDAAGFHRHLPLFRDLLLQHAPATSLAFVLDRARLTQLSGFFLHMAYAIVAGAERIIHGELAQGIRTIRGCGVGLTPGGDDFIAGLLIALHVEQRLSGQDFQPKLDLIYHHGQSANPFVNAFLNMAWQGRVTARVKDAVQAITDGDAQRIDRACRHWLAMGATSGADLASGFVFAITAAIGCR